MFVHIRRPCSFLLLLFDTSDNFCQECACSGSRVKDLHAVFGNHFTNYRIAAFFHFLDRHIHFACVCKTFRQREIGFENIIHSTDNKLHHGLGRIIDTIFLLGCRVIELQEIFVEMNHRVTTLHFLAEVLAQFLDIRCSKDIHQIIHYPCNGIVNIIAC